MNVIEINKKIEETYDKDLYERLSDKSLLNLFQSQKSTHNKMKQLRNICVNYIHNEKIIENIINDFLLNLIPAGTKGVVRGIQFNKLIKEKILSFYSNNKNLEIYFEKPDEIINTDEIPDFLIINRNNNKKILDLIR